MTILSKKLAYAISKKYLLDEFKRRGGFYSTLDGNQLRIAKRNEYRRYSTHEQKPIVRLYRSHLDEEEVNYFLPIVQLADGTRWAFDGGEWYSVQESRGKKVKPFVWSSRNLKCSIMRQDMIDVQA